MSGDDEEIKAMGYLLKGVVSEMDEAIQGRIFATRDQIRELVNRADVDEGRIALCLAYIDESLDAG